MAAPKRVVTVGRHYDCDLVLDQPSMSRLHAYFRLDRSRRVMSLIDYDSTNGTRVNREFLSRNCPRILRAEDTIAFGKAFGGVYHTPESVHRYIADFAEYL